MSAPAVAIRRSPLEEWIGRCVGVSPAPLTRAAIEDYQLAKLRETLQWARRSAFYAHHLQGFDDSRLSSLDDLRLIPFTTPAGLAEHSSQFVCVSQDEICRVITLSTSGTSGEPKRLFFTAADQERTMDFFQHGVSTLTSPGDKMLIALPWERHGSVGALLAQGITRSGVVPIPYGLIADPVDVLDTMAREEATSIIGFPVQVLGLAELRGALADRVFSKVRSIVLCSDHVPEVIVRRVRQRAVCDVFEHYGMTETGLGGGVDCEAHAGYHLREADLLCEIVDPVTGKPIPDGATGEVVITTLSRQAMPLIRYRTGDLSSWSAEPCACGSVLKNLRRIRNRVDGRVRIGNCGEVTIAELDDVLFEIPGLVDYSASLTPGQPAKLKILCCVLQEGKSFAKRAGFSGLEQKVGTIARGIRSGELRIEIEATSEPFVFRGAKRRIEVHSAS